MSDNPIPHILKSAELRQHAADALRDSRKKSRPVAERERDRKVAKAYKDLAEHTEWLDGRKSRKD